MRRALAFVAALLFAQPAVAKGWETPAAGESASGDIELLFTFDDGPSPTTTPQVLDILKAHHIHAIFFLVGEMAESGNKKVPAIIERIKAEGHIIANHTQTHADLCRVKEEKANRELDNGKSTIERVAKIQIQWFRAPYGVRCDRVDSMLAERHIHHFHWDLDPQEWRHGNLDKTVKYVTGELARGYGRNVLLMHDIKAVTVKALPEILKWIDDENAKRAKSRKRKIRILAAPELAREQLAKGLPEWLDEATSGAQNLPETLASVLP